ncbi:MAG TPA: ABC transporter permease [Caldilineaceae bacterium]|nr:ABC transporter permease [Caldilineaceae bacterium]
MATAQRLALAQEPIRTLSQRQRMWRTFTRNRTAVVGLLMVAAVTLAAVAAPLLSPHDPLVQETRERLAPPSDLHPLGQDDYGRDILARLIYAARISLLVGVASVLLGGALGTAMGVIAGYRRGITESILMRVVDTLLAFPDLITGLLVLAVLGAGLDKMIFAIALVISPRFARLAHGPTLALREKDFVNAARAIGVGDLRMVSRHILPNLLGELLVMASLWTASAIRIEANLSFIGLGVAPPTPTWGQMIRDGTVHLTTAPWFSIWPGLAVLFTVLAFNLLGDGLRDVLDPKLQS